MFLASRSLQSARPLKSSSVRRVNDHGFSCNCRKHVPSQSTVCSRAIVIEDSTVDDSVIEAAKDPIISELADRILEAEAELKSLFEPGKAMPSAGSVAKKRQAIMDMKSLLATRLNGQELTVNAEASDNEAERARRLFLETQVERSLQRQQRSKSGEDVSKSANNSNFELTLLEVENERLRDKAERLLLRQQMLEDIAEGYQLVTREGGRLIWRMPSVSS
ncbi:hypothetical protein CEUSTIGMA_g4778.t1 [Chlamydomonas eustigma]|uniref:Uncharacterized protein n=1 Tax=Chlamydomonas eustigma TaxID=1157962 RepID=A0A250X357_9CHLO|nr:hypothetical protein CEUSTIGMA_g4778.t1 [Chlamydomonas eustigma]|eukprot:GAX77332.1 hypothetical protein CEUSTIGMA_g4778.t1 [Chlamydomonas eustigma]